MAISTPGGEHRGPRRPIDGRIASVFVRGSDVRRSADWYGKLLGLPVRPEDTFFDHLHVFKLENGVDLLLDSKGFTQHGDRPVQCMFATVDIDAAYAHARALGVEIVDEIERVGPVSWFNFRDPDGNVHMVCQQRG